jgi:hypothetical protein
MAATIQQQHGGGGHGVANNSNNNNNNNLLPPSHMQGVANSSQICADYQRGWLVGGCLLNFSNSPTSHHLTLWFVSCRSCLCMLCHVMIGRCFRDRCKYTHVNRDGVIVTGPNVIGSDGAGFQVHTLHYIIHIHHITSHVMSCTQIAIVMMMNRKDVKISNVVDVNAAINAGNNPSSSNETTFIALMIDDWDRFSHGGGGGGGSGGAPPPMPPMSGIGMGMGGPMGPHMGGGPASGGHHMGHHGHHNSHHHAGPHHGGHHGYGAYGMDPMGMGMYGQHAAYGMMGYGSGYPPMMGYGSGYESHDCMLI